MLWYAFPIGIGVGIWLEGQSVKRSFTLAAVGSGITFIINRGGLRLAWGAGTAVAFTPLVYIAGAYVGGSLIGTGISYALFGKEGARDAITFYGNPVTAPGKLAEALVAAPAKIQAITLANRAVENNAAGVRAGQQVRATVAPGLLAQHDWAVANRERLAATMGQR